MKKHSRSTKHNIAKSKMLRTKISFTQLIPSILTTMALCIAVTAIKYAMDGRFILAATSIMIAALFDMLDGRVARMLKASSNFGAQFDSLSDLGSFGISAGIVLYLWTIENAANYHNMMWWAIIVYISCVALRLARFNIESEEYAATELECNTQCSSAYKRLIASGYFFNGVPSTLAAILLLAPMIATFELITIPSSMITPIMIPYTIFISALMLCRIPTLSLKRLKVEGKYLSFSLFIIAILCVLLLLEPWIIIPILTSAYTLLIPITWLRCRKMLTTNNIKVAKNHDNNPDSA